MGLLAALVTGCSSSAPTLNDSEKIVRSVLAFLTSDGSRICVDQRTRENPLAVYREMALAPLPARQMLGWSAPRPLWPEAELKSAAFVRSEIAGEKISLAQPSFQAARFPGQQQMIFDGAAMRLVRGAAQDQNDVSIDSSWAPHGVSPRWWVANRFRSDCSPHYTISNVLRGREMAFVTVHSEHWGTLYAVVPQKGQWKIAAEWSRWLY